MNKKINKKAENKRNEYFFEIMEAVKGFIKWNKEENELLCSDLQEFVDWGTELDREERFEFMSYVLLRWNSYIKEMRNRTFTHISKTKEVWNSYLLRLKVRENAYELYKKDVADATKIEEFETFLDAEYQVNWYIESLLTSEELLKAYHEDLKWQSGSAEAIISRKVNAAEGMFRIMYPTEEERNKRAKILDEVQFQIEVCEGFLKSIPEETVKEWLQLKNAIQVQNRAHNHKLSKFGCAS